jgi:ATP-dependent helicase YprA (DUF1998 family)
LPAARVLATADELEAVPDDWRRLSPFKLRAVQAAALGRIAAGGDHLIVAGTSSGKGLLMQLPAMAAAAAAVRAEDEAAELPSPPPVTLCVVPYRALAEHLTRTTA